MLPAAPSDPPRRTLKVGEQTVAYTEEGNGSNTLLAVHGFPGSGRDFRWLAAALHDDSNGDNPSSSDVRLVRVDLPGYGGSSRSTMSGQPIAARAQSVIEFHEALGLGPITLVTHSSGSTVGAHLARHRPDLVVGCAFVAPAGPRPHFHRTPMRMLSAVLGTRGGRALTRPLLGRAFVAMGFPRSVPDSERVFTMMDAAAMDFARHADNLAELDQPCLLAWAEDDPLIPADINEEMSALISRGPRLRFSEGGHNIQKTKATEIAAALRVFAAQPTGSRHRSHP